MNGHQLFTNYLTRQIIGWSKWINSLEFFHFVAHISIYRKYCNVKIYHREVKPERVAPSSVKILNTPQRFSHPTRKAEVKNGSLEFLFYNKCYLYIYFDLRRRTLKTLNWQPREFAEFNSAFTFDPNKNQTPHAVNRKTLVRVCRQSVSPVSAVFASEIDRSPIIISLSNVNRKVVSVN